MLGVVAAALVLAGLVVFLVKFATADGDFTVTSRGAPKRDQVEGKVVWITGASRGIGEILANQFTNLGAKVILSARNTVELERVKSEIITKYPASGVEVLPMDLASGEESLKESVYKAESLFSSAGVDYMVHNAAFERPKRKALDETEEGLQATMNINVIGTIMLTHLLAPYMLKRGRGHFVVVSSAAGKCPSPGQALYSASKHALNGYFHSLRSELCQEGIKVTIVCPGPIETSKTSETSSSGKSRSLEKRVSAERCAELIIVAATHGLKEAWISYQPVLFVMYLVQYMPTIGYWFMDLIGANRLDAAASKGSAYSWSLLFGHKKSA
ncbi:Dehydrogenase reductase SDR family member [Musa troglodytarum]|uniref:Dehydrogenase reductase SDR family member n=1 Tax=Musa troglodytarum TaxID=320322 RepID=A0A9E7GEN1_9LILI|nr:Dehydrogenase reductase SDR family member [Musa troglodytarum]